jgi:hypothetical protein
MLRFEEYLADFTNTVNLTDFLINLIVATLLSLIIREYYIRFGQSISNRSKFASIFVPLALATMLIITVVQASIALSLGLVGALSIVRFRAAIKEPEELTYLFLIIGVGLVTGANKPVLAVVAMACIIPIIYFTGKMRGSQSRIKDALFININTKEGDIEKITSIVGGILPWLELKRMDTKEDGLFVSYIGKAGSVKQLSELKEALLKLDPTAEISIIDQPELIL